MTQRVIDGLEAIQVDEHNGDEVSCAPCRCQGMAQPVQKQGADRQARHAVVIGHMGNNGFGLAPLGDFLFQFARPFAHLRLVRVV